MNPKPAKGERRSEQRARRRRITITEADAKRKAKERDNWTCRRCGVTYRDKFIAAAHINGKGMGGDAGLRSSDPADYVAMCEPNGCHQGPRSVHSGHIRIHCLTDARGDGPVEFIDQQPGDRHGRSHPV